MYPYRSGPEGWFIAVGRPCEEQVKIKHAAHVTELREHFIYFDRPTVRECLDAARNAGVAQGERVQAAKAA